MKTINTISLVILTACAVLASSSCSKQLDIAQHGNVSTKETFYTTDENVENAVANMYLGMQQIHIDFYYCLNSLDGDSWTGGNSRGENTNLERFNEYSFDASHEWLERLYKGIYSFLYDTNLITDSVEGNTSVMRRAVAEAKVMRAFANFYLVSLWGNAPLVDHVLRPDEYRVSNATPEQFWASIESDLQDALSSGDLTSKSNLTDRNGAIRVTREFAYALLGKAYLWQKKYAQSAEAFDKVIDSNLYGLWGVEEPGEYEMVRHAVASNSCESMLEAQWRNDPSMVMTLPLTTLWISMALNHNYFEGSNEDVIPGWGFCVPSKNLYDAFVAEEGADGYRLTQSIKTPEQLTAYGLNLKTGTVHSSEGLFNWKFSVHRSDLVLDFPGFQAFEYMNFSFMRFAEVLLCAAEANYMAGNQSKADQYLNRVRTRAKLPSKTGVTMDDIKTEKRIELCFECVRYMDLVRWGDASAVLADQGHYVPDFSWDAETGKGTILEHAYTNTVYGFKERNKYLPIPANELMVNPNMSQNPGW